MRGLTLDTIELNVDQADSRPALVLDDVHHARMMTIRATTPTEGPALAWLRSVQDCRLSGLRARAGPKAVLRLSGADTARITLRGKVAALTEPVTLRMPIRGASSRAAAGFGGIPGCCA